uniref:Uncharacterized protein n=1 Tax=Oryza nivara TaxID=4536 RepID=A0A0E0HU94_ORYNI
MGACRSSSSPAPPLSLSLSICRNRRASSASARPRILSRISLSSAFAVPPPHPSPPRQDRAPPRAGVHRPAAGAAAAVPVAGGVAQADSLRDRPPRGPLRRLPGCPGREGVLPRRGRRLHHRHRQEATGARELKD